MENETFELTEEDEATLARLEELELDRFAALPESEL
jgi:hypothetical protein